MERGDSILARYGGIEGSWRTGSEGSSVEEQQAKVLCILANAMSRVKCPSQLSQNLLRPLFPLPSLLIRLLPHLYPSLMSL